MTSPDQTPATPADDQLRSRIRLAISDPGAFLPKYSQSKGEPYETVSQWSARAVETVLTPVLEGLHAELDAAYEQRNAANRRADENFARTQRAKRGGTAVQSAVVADLRQRAERYRDRANTGRIENDGPHAFAAQVLDHLAMGYEIALPEPTPSVSDQAPATPAECDCYPKLHASYPNAKAYVCPTCGSQWAPMMDGHGRWLWLHKPAPASDVIHHAAPSSDPDDDPLDNMPLGILATTEPKRYVAAPSSVQGDTTPEESQA